MPMKNMKSFSNVIENIYTTALAVCDEVGKDKIFEMKDLSIELSVVIEQKLTNSRKIDTKVHAKSASCYDGLTRKENNFSSQIKISFIPKSNTLNQYSM